MAVNLSTDELLTAKLSLLTPPTINGVSFDGHSSITVPAAAGSLIGLTLAANVIYSALQRVGVLQAPHMVAPVVDSGGLAVSGPLSITGAAPLVLSLNDATRTVNLQTTGGTGAMPNGAFLQMQTSHGLSIATGVNLGNQVVIAYRDTGAGVYRSALDVAATNGFATVNLLPAGGTVLLPAGIAGGAPFRIPHGAAPSAPVNGDIWTTTAGLFVRVNGATVGPLT